MVTTCFSPTVLCTPLLLSTPHTPHHSSTNFPLHLFSSLCRSGFSLERLVMHARMAKQVSNHKHRVTSCPCWQTQTNTPTVKQCLPLLFDSGGSKPFQLGGQAGASCTVRGASYIKHYCCHVVLLTALQAGPPQNRPCSLTLLLPLAWKLCINQRIYSRPITGNFQDLKRNSHYLYYQHFEPKDLFYL